MRPEEGDEIGAVLRLELAPVQLVSDAEAREEIVVVGKERLADLKAGEATLTMEMRDDLQQPSGILHGGVTATLIDTAMAFAMPSIRKRVNSDKSGGRLRTKRFQYLAIFLNAD